MHTNRKELAYNASVNAGDFWKAVGKQLREARAARHWSASKVEREGGPSYKTVLTIEHGRVGNLPHLERHAKALNLNVLDIFQAIFASEESPITPEFAQILRAYQEGDVEGRNALVAVAAAILRVSPPSASDPPPPGPRRLGPGK